LKAQKSARRSSRDKLLTAARELMCESGYAAVTSRRVAARAGLKPQLVHYYFDTMDDLFLALYREYADGLLEQQRTLLESDKPLREMWRIATEARGGLLTEFVALANHRKVIQQQITEFGREYRKMQIENMTRILGNNPVAGLNLTPAFAALLLNSLARGIVMENQFDILDGHAEAQAVIEGLIERIDG